MEKNRRSFQRLFPLLFLVLLFGQALAPPPAALAQGGSEQAQVAAFIKANSLDPGSYEGIDWSKPVKFQDGPHSSAIRHIYRLNDPMYGLVTFDDIFYLDAQGRVMGSTNISYWRGPHWGAGKEKW